MSDELESDTEYLAANRRAAMALVHKQAMRGDAVCAATLVLLHDVDMPYETGTGYDWRDADDDDDDVRPW